MIRNFIDEFNHRLNGFDQGLHGLVFLNFVRVPSVSSLWAKSLQILKQLTNQKLIN